MNAIVIIDMQPQFSSCRNRRLEYEILNQIKSAIEQNHHIIIVSYITWGPILSSIKKAIKGYDKVSYVRKRKISGATHLVKHFNKTNWPTDIKFMGIQTNVCIKGTVLDLHKHIQEKKRNTSISIVKKACRDYNKLGNFTVFSKVNIPVI